jgi:hemoglobin
MLESLTLPAGLTHVRTTPVFDATSVPEGLRRAHQVAEGVWGVLRVHTGTVTFVDEASGESREVRAGEHQVIAPATLHHVDPADGATFAVEFHR